MLHVERVYMHSNGKVARKIEGEKRDEHQEASVGPPAIEKGGPLS